MKILYWPIVDYDNVKQTRGIEYCGDYVIDCLFHGFRKEFGSDCIDYPQNPLMYKSQDKYRHLFPHKGFSMFGRIDDEEIDREDIELKLKNNYFDFIVSPIHHTNRNNQEVILRHIDYISQFIKKSKFAVICSDENPNSNMFLFGNQKFIFFKCELMNKYAHACLPISYSIPEEIITKNIPEKKLDFAPLMPSFLRQGHPHEKTYIYQDEESYYNDYRQSYFGFTCKKGGWDKMRDWEMMACGCMPYYTDLEYLPERTQVDLPQSLLLGAKRLRGLFPNWINPSSIIGTCMEKLYTTGHKIEHQIFRRDYYFFLLEKMINHIRQHGTTKARAKYIIESLLAWG